MTGVLIRGENRNSRRRMPSEDRHTDTEGRWPREDEGKD